MKRKNSKEHAAAWVSIELAQALAKAAKDKYTSKSSYLQQALAEKLEEDGYYGA